MVLLKARLDSMGYNPFVIAEDITVYPQTFAEFLTFYEINRPAVKAPNLPPCAPPMVTG